MPGILAAFRKGESTDNYNPIYIEACLNPVTVGAYFIHSYEGKPVNIKFPLLECFGRTQAIQYILFGCDYDCYIWMWYMVHAGSYFMWYIIE